MKEVLRNSNGSNFYQFYQNKLNSIPNQCYLMVLRRRNNFLFYGKMWQKVVITRSLRKLIVTISCNNLFCFFQELVLGQVVKYKCMEYECPIRKWLQRYKIVKSFVYFTISASCTFVSHFTCCFIIADKTCKCRDFRDIKRTEQIKFELKTTCEQIYLR